MSRPHSNLRVVQSEEKPDRQKSALQMIGGISLLGLAAVLIFFTYYNKVDYADLLRQILLFSTGGVEQIPKWQGEDLFAVLLVITPVCLLSLAASYVVAIILSVTVGIAKSYDADAMDTMLGSGPMLVFVTIFLEEVVARQIPLGWMYPQLATWFPQINPALMFYVLMLAGNLVWSRWHYVNLKDKKEHAFENVLPQFVGGFFLAYLFWRYGFFITLMAHYLFDVLLFSSNKKNPVKASNWRITFYYAIVGGISWFLANLRGDSLRILRQWLHETNQLRPIEGLNFWDYAFLLITVYCAFQVMSGLLMLDRGLIPRESFTPKATAVAILFQVFVILGCSKLFSFFVEDVLVRSLAVSLLLSFLTNITSGSMLARYWFMYAPALFLIIIASNVLGIAEACGLTAIFIILRYLPSKTMLQEQLQSVGPKVRANFVFVRSR